MPRHVLPSSLCHVSMMLLYLHDELVREIIKQKMSSTKHNNFFSYVISLVFLLLHLPEWYHSWWVKRVK